MITLEQIDILRDAPVEAPSMIVDGRQCVAAGSSELMSPLNESHLTDIPFAQLVDVKAAVSAARRRQVCW